MNNIREESGRKLLEWFEHEVRNHCYDPNEVPPPVPYTIPALKEELLRRLDSFDYLDNRCSEG
jgi:hypothetical protein